MVPVGILVETMTYLGVPSQDVYVKPTIVHNLICRIQNLFPETCLICLESYCVGKDELRLLPCSICGQACHTPCVLGLFGISMAEKNSFGPREAECKMNLHHLPGILKKVQSVLNRAARLIFNLPPRVPTTSSLTKLHWLPLKARIEFKICLITFKALKFNQPSYIRELLSFSSHESTLGLRSADDPYRLHEPGLIEERGFANRSFSNIAPSLYDKLPITIKLIDSLNTFKSHLKAYLFSFAYDQSGLAIWEDYAL